MKTKTIVGAGVIVLAVTIPAMAETSREKIEAFCEARTFVAASLYKAFPVIADHLLLSEKLLSANKKWIFLPNNFQHLWKSM